MPYQNTWEKSSQQYGTFAGNRPPPQPQPAGRSSNPHYVSNRSVSNSQSLPVIRTAGERTKQVYKIAKRTNDPGSRWFKSSDIIGKTIDEKKKFNYTFGSPVAKRLRDRQKQHILEPLSKPLSSNDTRSYQTSAAAVGSPTNIPRDKEPMHGVPTKRMPRGEIRDNRSYQTAAENIGSPRAQQPNYQAMGKPTKRVVKKNQSPRLNYQANRNSYAAQHQARQTYIQANQQEMEQSQARKTRKEKYANKARDNNVKRGSPKRNYTLAKDSFEPHSMAVRQERAQQEEFAPAYGPEHEGKVAFERGSLEGLKGERKKGKHVDSSYKYRNDGFVTGSVVPTKRASQREAFAPAYGTEHEGKAQISGMERNHIMQVRQESSQREGFAPAYGKHHEGKRGLDGLATGIVPMESKSHKAGGGYGKQHRGKAAKDSLREGLVPANEMTRKASLRTEGRVVRDNLDKGLAPKASASREIQCVKNVRKGNKNKATLELQV